MSKPRRRPWCMRSIHTARNRLSEGRWWSGFVVSMSTGNLRSFIQRWHGFDLPWTQRLAYGTARLPANHGRRASGAQIMRYRSCSYSYTMERSARTNFVVVQSRLVIILVRRRCQRWHGDRSRQPRWFHLRLRMAIYRKCQSYGVLHVVIGCRGCSITHMILGPA